MKRYSRAIATEAIAVIVFCFSTVDAVCGLIKVEPIAWRGDPAPGGGTFTLLEPPSLNNRGQVAFEATTTASAPGRLWSSALFLGRPGDLRDIARTSSPAPGTDAVFHSQFSLPLLNDRGQVLFSAYLKGDSPAITEWGTWAGDPDNVSLIFRKGAPAFGVPGQFTSIRHPVLNNGGHVAYWATTTDQGDIEPILFAGEPGNFGPVLLPENVYPGRPELLWHSIVYDENALNISDRGAIGVSALISRRTDPTEAVESAVMLIKSDGIQFIIPPSTVTPNWIRVNNRGNVAFFLQEGIRIGPPELPKLAVSIGDRVPGAGDTRITEIGLHGARLSNGNHLAFHASLSGPSGGGTLMVATRDSFRIAARNGERAPGLELPASWNVHYHPFAINSAGHVAFEASLFGPNSHALNSSALYAEDPSGQLTLVIREGYPWQISPNHVAVVRDFEWTAVDGGSQRAAWNDLHQIALRVTFWDGRSGNFLVTVVPEPTPTVLLIVSAILLTVLTLSRRFRGRRA
jgi:hypothetical protein